MFEAVILGIVQGLTEFIPVSSSAHLILFPWFFKWKGAVNTLGFDVALHLGTLIALVVYFRKDWLDLLRTARNRDAMIWHIVIATIPAAAAGLIFHDAVEALRSPGLIVFTLSAVAALMILVERTKKGSEGAGINDISRKDALIIGAAQALALVPGVSRSGITIVAGLMRGVQRQAAARFSFLMSTPVIAGAGFIETRKLVLSGDADLQADIFTAGIAVSAVTGYIAIKFLLRFLQNHSLSPFAYYRFLLAFVIILIAWAHR